MEETIFFNVDLRKDGNQNIAIMKIRLWPSLIAFNTWLLAKGYRPTGKVGEGTGLTILNNLAIVVEGFITDLIVEELKQRGAAAPTIKFNPEKDTWNKKKQVYNLLFPTPLQNYSCFDTADILFTFRNNIAHGRSHDEVSKIEAGSGKKAILESANPGYQKIREFLIIKKLLPVKDTSSNVDVLWQCRTAVILSGDIRAFLYALKKTHTAKHFEGMMAEMEYAFQNRY